MNGKAIVEMCRCSELFHPLKEGSECTDPGKGAHPVRSAPSSTLVLGGRAATANLVCDDGTQSSLTIPLTNYVTIAVHDLHLPAPPARPLHPHKL